MAQAAGKRRSTIYDIAKATKASPATVSVVLNGSWTRYRIKDETAKRVLKAAEDLGYAVNMKARGLRLSRSGLAGMILPHHRNRFFAGLAEAFETEARQRGLCPIVVSTQRDEAIEVSVTTALLSQQVEFLFVVGVRNPQPLNALCRAARIPSINIDLPGNEAPSVVSDNFGGARALTEVLIEKMRSHPDAPKDLYFLGGIAGEYATDKRVAGFNDAIAACGMSHAPHDVDCCGYRPSSAKAALAQRYETLGRMPGGLFINSITAFEGLVQFTSFLPRSAMDNVCIGCFDWDPFAAHLPFDVTMTRQNVEAMIAAGFSQIEGQEQATAAGAWPVVLIPTEFSPDSEGESAWREKSTQNAAD
ncbi:MAG TPA: LacI family DNA-binding transcriptional regulator [Stellaceae bacterium]|nr:LacI family DNA-binding transcriptional regulator [Stellaceae bacterium]